jgi:quinol monooxygenase YgiN
MQYRRAFSESVRRSKSLLAPLVFAVGACAHDGPPPASNAPPPAATAESSPGGADAASNDVRGRGGASVFVVHEIEDFEAFKKYLDEGADARAKAGVLGYLLSRLDDGRLVIHFFAKDVKTVEAALNSPDMQAYLSRKGAPDASLVWLALDERVTIPASPPTEKTWSLYYKLKTADFAAFERAFDERSRVYTEQGVIGVGLHRSTAQNDVLILHFMGTDRDKLAALPKRPEFVELLALAGGEKAPAPLLGEDLVRNRPK